ncbi:MAG: helix-turn-helix domain-containing protein [Victivallales bacterium]|nr:helix-turn-helix domain-containing protein [Victivallales bacterium]
MDEASKNTRVRTIYKLSRLAKTALPLAAWRETPLVSHTRPHTHDCYEMIFIQDGTGWCAINGHQFTMLYGDVFILTPGDVHEFCHRHEMHFYNLMFSTALLNGHEATLLETLLNHPGKYTCDGHVTEQLLHLLNKLCVELQETTSPQTELSAHGIFLEIMALLVRGTAGPRAPDHNLGEEKRTEHLQNILSVSPYQKIELQQIAQELGVSRDYAGKLVRKVTGMSLGEYMRVRRIEHSLHELADTSKTITEIAISLGFYDSAFFNKQFHRVMGCSPKEYRTRIRLAVGKEPPKAK